MKIGELKIYNTLNREKELFEPLHENVVGLYVCGPTVYSDVHLGNCRTFTFFDVVYRYLKHRYGKVRYVRNITDVGHLENDDIGTGEDKIAKRARLEQLEPMEVVQKYTNGFHEVMLLLNNIPPSIEPTAIGHLIEQIEMVQQILDNGYAYESNGSVYFDVEKYRAEYNSHAHLPHYGKLSGKVIDDLMTATREELEGIEEKRNPSDFAIWKKTPPEHIMAWDSPWGKGVPGWHLECSVMSTKYLGETFDIHGGGMDLKFPHHECEIAQSVGSCGKSPVRFWMHTNMLTVNGTKMSKSLNNSFLPHELFAGAHHLLEQPYSPMTVRFFFLCSNYRSQVDFSNKALKQAELGYKRIMTAKNLLNDMTHPGNETAGNTDADTELKKLSLKCYEHINDDFNTAMVVADLYELASFVNKIHNKQLALKDISQATFEQVKQTYNDFVTDILGLRDETNAGNDGLVDGLMDLVLKIRTEARNKKDWGTSDLIRDDLKALNLIVKDSKEGSEWSIG